MANFVKIATISCNPCAYGAIPAGADVTAFVIAHLKKELAQVLPLKPDLVLLPECCDRPDGMPIPKRNEYYRARGTRIYDFIARTAKENACYIAYGTHRIFADGTARNSLVMAGRQGEFVGAYDKNHILPSETENTNILCGADATVFNCDFGRVGGVICFDLNFSEIREKYKALQPDLVLFSSNFGGGLMRNFFAFNVGCYFASACGYNCSGAIIDPLGETICTSSNHYDYTFYTVNLDYATVHLDNHWEKIRAAREKYPLLTVKDIGYVGVVLLSYAGTDRTTKDILREFGIITAKEYFNNALAHRAKYTAKN